MLTALESWEPVASLRQSAWAYPIASGCHVLALSVLVGSVAIMDLRLAGCLQRLDRTAVMEALVPVSLLAFSACVTSGLLLFVPAGREYLASPYFLVKLTLIALAGLNAAGLHWALTTRRGDTTLRAFGVASLALWTMVVFAGRMLAFG